MGNLGAQRASFTSINFYKILISVTRQSRTRDQIHGMSSSNTEFLKDEQVRRRRRKFLKLDTDIKLFGDAVLHTLFHIFPQYMGSINQIKLQHTILNNLLLKFDKT